MLVGFVDKKRSWFSRQFSGKINQEYDYTDGGEFPTALAAAAFAINSLEESHVQAQRKANGGPDKRESFGAATNENMPGKVIGPAPSIRRSPTTADKQFNSTANEESKDEVPEKTVVSAPTKPESKVPKPDLPIKKAPTFADKNLNNTATAKTESTLPKPEFPSTFPPTEIRRQSSTKPGIENTKADVWEKDEMAKIKEWYEKLSATILAWEMKKKKKAKRRMDKIEGELERRRAKAMQHYRSKMGMTDQIAGGARAQAEKNRRNEEVQVKEKANKIRSTGKSPATCFCF